MGSVQWCLDKIAACLYKDEDTLIYDKSLPHDELQLSFACHYAKQHIELGNITREEFDEKLVGLVTRTKP